MTSLAHTPAVREQRPACLADLAGDQSTPVPEAPASSSTAERAWQQAVTQVSDQLCARLHVAVAPERIRKALDLVLAHAVTLHADGTASVTSGTQTYTLSPACPCADARHRTEFCKHTLAVELHRRALAMIEDTAAGSPAPAVSSAPASATWDVHEAPASACFRFRVGTMELMYTLRGIDDAELQRRITATLPTLQEVIDGCEERAARRATARDAAQAPQTPAAADLQELVQHAIQQALAAQVPTLNHPPAPGQASDPQTPAPQSSRPATNSAMPFCHLHQAPLELRSNASGSWWSHWVANEKRYCKGDA